ncbi:hypothetical protein Tco_1254444 [Tanacetum coccineum]
MILIDERVLEELEEFSPGGHVPLGKYASKLSCTFSSKSDFASLYICSTVPFPLTSTTGELSVSYGAWFTNSHLLTCACQSHLNSIFINQIEGTLLLVNAFPKKISTQSKAIGLIRLEMLKTPSLHVIEFGGFRILDPQFVLGSCWLAEIVGHVTGSLVKVHSSPKANFFPVFCPLLSKPPGLFQLLSDQFAFGFINPASLFQTVSQTDCLLCFQVLLGLVQTVINRLPLGFDPHARVEPLTPVEGITWTLDC